MERIKKIAFWVGVFPLIFSMWGTISAAVYNLDIVVDTVQFLINEYGGTGMTGFEIMSVMVDAFIAEKGLIE